MGLRDQAGKAHAEEAVERLRPLLCSLPRGEEGRPRFVRPRRRAGLKAGWGLRAGACVGAAHFLFLFLAPRLSASSSRPYPHNKHLTIPTLAAEAPVDMDIEGAAADGGSEKKKGGGLMQVEEMVATWKGLLEEEKEPWTQKAAELKAAYHQELVRRRRYTSRGTRHAAPVTRHPSRHPPRHPTTTHDSRPTPYPILPSLLSGDLGERDERGERGYARCQGCADRRHHGRR